MADKAHIATDKKLIEMERHLSAIYAEASKTIGEEWKQYLANAAKEVKPYQDAYNTAKKSGDSAKIKKAKDALAKKEREVTLADSHYREVTQRLSSELTNVNKTAVAYINNQLPEVYSLNYNSVGYGVSRASGYSFDMVDAHAVKNLAMEDKTLLPYKKIDTRKDVRWNTQRVNAQVLQGILTGESIPEIAKRFQNVMNMNANSAVRNARTAVTSAENKGRIDMLHDAEEKGVLCQKEWIATNDERTRDAHAELDGVAVDVDEPFVNEIGEIIEQLRTQF